MIFIDRGIPSPTEILEEKRHYLTEEEVEFLEGVSHKYIDGWKDVADRPRRGLPLGQEASRVEGIWRYVRDVPAPDHLLQWYEEYLVEIEIEFLKSLIAWDGAPTKEQVNAAKVIWESLGQYQEPTCTPMPPRPPLPNRIHRPKLSRVLKELKEMMKRNVDE